MNFEQQSEVFCPAVGEIVTIKDLYAAAAGGSCQVELELLLRQCVRMDSCADVGENASCLLQNND
jgi:hypothetical protein